MHRKFLFSLLLTFVLDGCAGFQAGMEVQSGRTALLSGQPELAVTYFERVSASNPDYVHDSIPLKEGIWTYLGRAYYALGKLPEADGALRKALKQNETDFMARLYLGLTLLRQPLPPLSQKPLTVQDIVYALKEGVTSRRVSALVRERGITFNLSEATEKELRISGADADLLQQIRIVAQQKIRTEQNLRREALREVEKALQEIRSWLQYTIGSPQGRFWDPTHKIRSQVEASLALISANKTQGQEFASGIEWLGKALEEEANLARRDERQELERMQRR